MLDVFLLIFFYFQTSYWEAELEEEEDSDIDVPSSSSRSISRMSKKELQRAVSEILTDISQYQFQVR